MLSMLCCDRTVNPLTEFTCDVRPESKISSCLLVTFLELPCEATIVPLVFRYYSDLSFFKAVDHLFGIKLSIWTVFIPALFFFVSFKAFPPRSFIDASWSIELVLTFIQRVV